MNTTLSETQVRALRDKVYEKPITDDGWKTCGANWQKPENVKWLQQQAAKHRIATL